eukprot:3954206-Prymnesium_polylepis.1
MPTVSGNETRVQTVSFRCFLSDLATDGIPYHVIAQHTKSTHSNTRPRVPLPVLRPTRISTDLPLSYIRPHVAQRLASS